MMEETAACQIRFAPLMWNVSVLRILKIALFLLGGGEMGRVMTQQMFLIVIMMVVTVVL